MIGSNHRAGGRAVNARLRVLYLTHHGPWPTTSGGRLRDAALIPEIARLADVEIWAVSRTPRVDQAATQQAPPGVKVRIFADEALQRSYPTRDSAAARAALHERLATSDSFDVIHVEGHYLVHLLPEEVRHRTVVVEHNVESHLLRQRAARSGLTSHLAADLDALVAAEEEVWTQVGLVVALSPEDQARILRRVPSAAVGLSTDGADHLPLGTAGASDRRLVQQPTFGFLANYAYPPNADALGWLLDELFPALCSRLPDCRLLLVGSNLDQAIDGRRVPAGVLAHGWIDDLTDFWSRIDVLLCPLRIGGGIKVKLIEAIRSGALSVSTSIGLEGLPTAAREAIIKADGTEEFISAAIELCSAPSRREGQRASVAPKLLCRPGRRSRRGSTTTG
jgi:glycosyltransferase involved in cell wall biosynthesis